MDLENGLLALITLMTLINVDALMAEIFFFFIEHYMCIVLIQISLQQHKSLHSELNKSFPVSKPLPPKVTRVKRYNFTKHCEMFK